jgi:hypothetical protein
MKIQFILFACFILLVSHGLCDDSEVKNVTEPVKPGVTTTAEPTTEVTTPTAEPTTEVTKSTAEQSTEVTTPAAKPTEAKKPEQSTSMPTIQPPSQTGSTQSSKIKPSEGNNNSTANDDFKKALKKHFDKETVVCIEKNPLVKQPQDSAILQNKTKMEEFLKGTSAKDCFKKPEVKESKKIESGSGASLMNIVNPMIFVIVIVGQVLML